MSSSSSLSSSFPSSSSSSRPRSSWLQVVLFTVLVYILLLSTACCHAVPVWKTSPLNSVSASKLEEDSAGAVGGIPSLPTREGEFDSPDSILQSCLEAANGEVEGNVFVKTLCTLAMMHTRYMKENTSHRGYVKRGIPSDRSSFSAFNRLVNRLREHADEVSDYQEKLNRMQALGILDSDYNVISVPDEQANLMRQLGMLGFRRMDGRD